MTSGKVWCVFESRASDDLYDQADDFVRMVGVYANEECARAAMLREASAVPVGDDDTHDTTWCRVYVSKWRRNSGGELYHDQDWEWWIEEREVE